MTPYRGPDPVESPDATPLRADDPRGLPSTTSSPSTTQDHLQIVNQRDAQQPGVPVEFHLRPLVPHAFELFAPAADVSRHVLGDRCPFFGTSSTKSDWL